MEHRRVAGVVALLACLLTTGCVGNAGPDGRTGTGTPDATLRTGPPLAATRTLPATGASIEPPQAQLPRGGRTLFPGHRLVGFAGNPQSRALGRLGVGDLGDRAREIERVAAPLAGGRTVLPVLELIATVVQSDPGRDGRYRTRSSDAVVGRYLAAARRVHGLLLLDIQPGRSDFLTEVRYYARWLREPDVGIALDPEWAMDPHDVPMRVFGHTTGGEIDRVARYLSGIVTANRLPEKALIYHQLAPDIVRREQDIRAHPGVVVVKSVDGIGTRSMKVETYRRLTRALPKAVHPGFKLFYDEDRRLGRLMTPAQVLALHPRPEYVLYE